MRGCSGMSDAEEVNKKRKKVKPASFAISEHRPPCCRFLLKKCLNGEWREILRVDENTYRKIKRNEIKSNVKIDGKTVHNEACFSLVSWCDHCELLLCRLDEQFVRHKQRLKFFVTIVQRVLQCLWQKHKKYLCEQSLLTVG
jgi:hypothetical protein